MMNMVSSMHMAVPDADYGCPHQSIAPNQLFAPEPISINSVSPVPTKLTWTTEDMPSLQDMMMSYHQPHMIYPDTHRLTGYDVLVGRHKLAFNHPGNKRFRGIVSMHLPRYFRHPCRKDRSMLIAEIVETIEQTGGRFLKETKSRELVEISEKEKRNKVGHALRDSAAAANTEQEPKGKTKKFMKQERLPAALEKCVVSSEEASVLDDDEIDFDSLFL